MLKKWYKSIRSMRILSTQKSKCLEIQYSIQVSFQNNFYLVIVSRSSKVLFPYFKQQPLTFSSTSLKVESAGILVVV